MKIEEVMLILEEHGTEQNRKIYARHGCDIPQFGVSISNLKKILKPIKKDKKLGYELFHSNNADAMYLSQWIVDSHTLTINDIKSVISHTDYYMILDNVIPGSIIENKDLSMQVIDEFLHHEDHRFRQVAYSLYSYMVLQYDTSLLNLNHIENTIIHIQSVIHNEQNRVRYNMNNFVIAAGGLSSLNSMCKNAAKEIGKVSVFMGETSCKVPDAYLYIEKMEQRGKIRNI